MPLSDAAIRQARPRDKPRKLYDSRGLYLEIAPRGSKAWHFKYRFADAGRIIRQLIPPRESIAEASQEITRIEQAILEGAVRIPDEFGGLQAALKRSIALKKQARRGLMHRGNTWQSSRLSEAHFL